MPIYQYKCKSCGYGLEAIQKMSDENLIICPKCDKPELKKQVTGTSFRLKGDGWFEK